MNINIYTTHEDQPYEFDTTLGISYLNIAVNNAPYRTGNLKHQIALNLNSKKTKRIVYNENNALYLHYLELGMGRNKMHTGFIENETVNAMLYETVDFLLTGETTFKTIPSIVFRTDRARSYEREILKRNNISINKRLTASDRATLSRIRQRELLGKLDKTGHSKGTIKPSSMTPMSTRDKLYYGGGKLRSGRELK